MATTPITKPIITDETGQLIVSALQKMAETSPDLIHDGTEYTNIPKWLAARRDTKRYTVIEPRYASSSLSACTRADAAAGLTCTPSTATVAGTDDFAGESVCEHHDCNAWLDEDGKQHVYAIRGQDDLFSLTPGLSPTGVQMDVCVLTPVLYYSFLQTDFTNIHSWSTSQLDGMDAQPGAFYADGASRGYMLYAKYAGGKDAAGKLRSASGLKLWNRTMSHNASHTAGAARGTGYSGKTIVDDWYVKSMLMLKYGTKNSQNVFAGCTSFDFGYPIAFDETGVQRVILTDAQAATLPVGSCLMMGTATSNPDRNNANAYSVFDAAMITAKEPLTGERVGYTAVYVDASAFNAVAGVYVKTAPYRSGYCDTVLGSDGSPVSPTSGREPFLIQGIECAVGAYEVLADVILKGSPEQEVWVCYNSSNYASEITANYAKVGTYSGVANQWNYTKEFLYAGGLLLPQGYGASTSTGIGDGYYLPAASSSLYKWPGGGGLNLGAHAGLSCVNGYYALGFAYWNIAGRLSLTGLRSA